MANELAEQKVENFGEEAQAFFKVAKQVDGPVVLAQGGEAQFVVYSIESYQEAQNRLKMLEAIVRGEIDIANGNTYSVKEVMSGLDEIIYS